MRVEVVARVIRLKRVGGLSDEPVALEEPLKAVPGNMTRLTGFILLLRIDVCEFEAHLHIVLDSPDGPHSDQIHFSNFDSEIGRLERIIS